MTPRRRRGTRVRRAVAVTLLGLLAVALSGVLVARSLPRELAAPAGPSSGERGRMAAAARSPLPELRWIRAAPG